MYLRLMNKLDVENIGWIIDPDDKDMLLERMLAITEILDSSYGDNRTSYGMGGFILYFPSIQATMDSLEAVKKFYNIDSSEPEYRDEHIGFDGNPWIEELYLLTSDDSLILLYPERKCSYE